MQQSQDWKTMHEAEAAGQWQQQQHGAGGSWGASAYGSYSQHEQHYAAGSNNWNSSYAGGAAAYGSYCPWTEQQHQHHAHPSRGNGMGGGMGQQGGRRDHIGNSYGNGGKNGGHKGAQNPKGAGKNGKNRGGKNAREIEDGWMCMACGNYNFARNKVCNMRICRAPRTPECVNLLSLLYSEGEEATSSSSGSSSGSGHASSTEEEDTVSSGSSSDTDADTGADKKEAKKDVNESCGAAGAGKNRKCVSNSNKKKEQAGNGSDDSMRSQHGSDQSSENLSGYGSESGSDGGFTDEVGASFAGRSRGMSGDLTSIKSSGELSTKSQQPTAASTADDEQLMTGTVRSAPADLPSSRAPKLLQDESPLLRASSQLQLGGLAKWGGALALEQSPASATTSPSGVLREAQGAEKLAALTQQFQRLSPKQRKAARQQLLSDARSDVRGLLRTASPGLSSLSKPTTSTNTTTTKEDCFDDARIGSCLDDASPLAPVGKPRSKSKSENATPREGDDKNNVVPHRSEARSIERDCATARNADSVPCRLARLSFFAEDIGRAHASRKNSSDTEDHVANNDDAAEAREAKESRESKEARREARKQRKLQKEASKENRKAKKKLEREAKKKEKREAKDAKKQEDKDAKKQEKHDKRQKLLQEKLDAGMTVADLISAANQKRKENLTSMPLSKDRLEQQKRTAVAGWICPNPACGNFNYDNRRTCNMRSCGAKRPHAGCETVHMKGEEIETRKADAKLIRERKRMLAVSAGVTGVAGVAPATGSMVGQQAQQPANQGTPILLAALTPPPGRGIFGVATEPVFSTYQRSEFGSSLASLATAPVSGRPSVTAALAAAAAVSEEGSGNKDEKTVSSSASASAEENKAKAKDQEQQQKLDDTEKTAANDVVFTLKQGPEEQKKIHSSTAQSDSAVLTCASTRAPSSAAGGFLSSSSSSAPNLLILHREKSSQKHQKNPRQNSRGVLMPKSTSSGVLTAGSDDRDSGKDNNGSSDDNSRKNLGNAKASGTTGPLYAESACSSQPFSQTASSSQSLVQQFGVHRPRFPSSASNLPSGITSAREMAEAGMSSQSGRESGASSGNKLMGLSSIPEKSMLEQCLLSEEAKKKEENDGEENKKKKEEQTPSSLKKPTHRVPPGLEESGKMSTSASWPSLLIDQQQAGGEHLSGAFTPPHAWNHDHQHNPQSAQLGYWAQSTASMPAYAQQYMAGNASDFGAYSQHSMPVLQNADSASDLQLPGSLGATPKQHASGVLDDLSTRSMAVNAADTPLGDCTMRSVASMPAMVGNDGSCFSPLASRKAGSPKQQSGGDADVVQKSPVGGSPKKKGNGLELTLSVEALTHLIRSVAAPEANQADLAEISADDVQKLVQQLKSSSSSGGGSGSEQQSTKSRGSSPLPCGGKEKQSFRMTTVSSGEYGLLTKDGESGSGAKTAGATSAQKEGSAQKKRPKRQLQ